MVHRKLDVPVEILLAFFDPLLKLDPHGSFLVILPAALRAHHTHRFRIHSGLRRMFESKLVVRGRIAVRKEHGAPQPAQQLPPLRVLFDVIEDLFHRVHMRERNPSPLPVAAENGLVEVAFFFELVIGPRLLVKDFWEIIQADSHLVPVPLAVVRQDEVEGERTLHLSAHLKLDVVVLTPQIDLTLPRRPLKHKLHINILQHRT